MQSRRGHIDNFISKGKHMISKGHVLSGQINEKITNLAVQWEVLDDIWAKRNELYIDNLDCRRWLENSSVMERWLIEREGLLRK